MSRTNIAKRQPPVTTHEGGPAWPHATPLARLRRTVMSCLLWEDEFYEDGHAIADRLVEVATAVAPADLAAVAIEARERHHLRHAPLLLLEVLSRAASGNPLVGATVARVIQRADEVGEMIALHHRMGGKHMLPAQMRKGLAAAMTKFNEYHLGKYRGDNSAVSLRDAFRLVRPKPTSDEQAALWHRAVKGGLAVPDTWEIALTRGADKRETFERLLRERKLGYLALLRNLRNMERAGVDLGLVRAAIIGRHGGAERVLPFRYVAAARAAPQFEPQLDVALQAAIAGMEPLGGRTIALADVSGSMGARLSARSDLTRMDAAAALASIIPSAAVRVMTFSDAVVEVPPRRGMAGVDAITGSQPHGGTRLGAALANVNRIACERLIVITDEQTADGVPAPTAPRAYMINVASARNGVGYGPRWVHIDGFSEGVLRYIAAVEADARDRS